LSALEDETGAITFWLPVATDAPSRVTGDSGMVDVGGVTVHAGKSVKVKLKGELLPGTILGPGSARGWVTIQWESDGSQANISAGDVRLDDGVLLQRQKWLKNPRVMAIIGPERSRRACALQVMAACETACPGLWSGAEPEALVEVRDGEPENDVIYNAESIAHEGPPAELEWITGPHGRQSLMRAAAAANCSLAYLGPMLVVVGFPHERERGREYTRWATLARRDSAATSLSVDDADMRDDVATQLVPDAKAQRLRPDKLLPVERDTSTLILMDDGGGSAIGEGQRRLLICGHNPTLRERAAAMIKDLLEAAAAGTLEAAQAIVGAAAPVAAPAVPPVAVPAAVPPVCPPAAPPRVVAQEQPRAVVPDLGKTNPLAVLQSMEQWPQSINEWGMQQKKIWRGHPPIPRTWIRIWSRSQNAEYYLRLSDKKTTFVLSEVS